MSDLQEKFKKIIDDLDKNIENKKDLEYIKTQVYNISILFMDELDKIAELNMDKMNRLIVKHKELNTRMQQMESTIKQIEDDIYLNDDDEDIGFEVICPYCNTEFEVDMNDEIKSEIKCPECNNVIELDWNQDDEGCSGHCCGCDGCEDSNEEDEDM